MTAHLQPPLLRERRRPHAGPHLQQPPAKPRGSDTPALPGGRSLLELGPMLPDRRVRAPLSSHSYLYELKLTGRRVRALVDHGRIDLLDAQGTDCCGDFAHITHSLGLLPGGPHVLDGVCTTQAGLSAPAAQLAPGGGTTLCLFDLLFHHGADVTEQPLLERKQRLFDLVGPELPSVIYMGHFEDCGRGLWQAVTQLQLDGVMARRKDSTYHASRRSGDWRVIERGAQAPR